MRKFFAFFLIIVFLISGCSLGGQVMTPIPIVTNNPSATLEITVSVTPTLIVPIAGDLGWGKIHGRITDGDTGAPVIGAVVSCEHHSYTSPATCSGTTTTNADGMYVFDKIFFHDTDTIKLIIEFPGYQPQEITQAGFTMPDMEANTYMSYPP
jgi:hypothetical protein